jgi:5-methylcytosine-specific restriction enzyme B
MNFWHMQLHPNEMGEWDVEAIRELLKFGLIGCDGDPVTDFLKINKGDIVLIRHGGTGVALVKALETAREIRPEEIEGKVWYSYCLKIRLLESYKDLWVADKGLFIPRTVARIDHGNKLGYPFISRLLHDFQEKFKMKNIIALLKHKPQIILQGPPGTGKTRLAKELAKAIASPMKVSGPMEKINEFFRSFDTKSEDAINGRKDDQEALRWFQSAFPIGSIGSMTTREYAIGTGSNDSFCWWLERGLQRIGYYTPGNCRSYLLYWSPSKNGYSLHGRVKQKEEQEAMNEIAGVWSELLTSKRYEKAGNYFGDSIILKVLNSYYPDEFFPINSIGFLEKAASLFGIAPAKRDPIELNRVVQDFFLKKKAEFKSDVNNIEFMRFLFGSDSEINLKTATSVGPGEIVSAGEVNIVQFHPAYSYEDFVRGIVAEPEGNGIRYLVTNKILLDIAAKAIANPESKYVLIIDEINRANLPSVLGELIYALEYRGDSVKGMYGLEGDEDEGHAIVIPPNLYIIGTMNTADRSVGHIDYAIRRRFAFVTVLPSRTVLAEAIADVAVRSKAEALFDAVAGLFGNDGIAPSFDAKDVQIGHSYFLAQTVDELRLKLEYEIKPILNEYLKDGILQSSTEELIQKLHV